MNPLKVVLFSLGSAMLFALLCLFFVNREPEGRVSGSEVSSGHPFFACMACHGADGSGNEVLLAPSLAGQRPEYLRLQVESFRKDWRGLDASGRLMAEAVRALDEQTIDDAIAYVSELPIKRIEPSQRDGDARHGEYLYLRSCAVCHGDSGEGSTMEADIPRLDLQDAWYLERQLAQYRNQQRGFHSEDTLGKVMSFYAQLLPDDQSVSDVVLWLSQLPEP